MMRSETLAQLAGVARAHGAAPQPQSTFAALDGALCATVGHRLFTILVHHRAQRESERVYSNMPDSYPVQGRKPVTDSQWMQQVMGRGLPYIGRNADDIREVFYDHALILSLGCESVLNIPLRWSGQTIGTLNLLHQENWYHVHHIELATVFAQLAVPAVMAMSHGSDPSC